MLSGLENPVHLLIVLLVVLLIFGAKRLPEIGRSLGSGMREFKNGITGQDVADAVAIDRDPAPASRISSASGTCGSDNGELARDHDARASHRATHETTA
jgi:sec-independent protein translocase protein TatA